MALEAINMRFQTPLHLGRGREELDKSELIYHSDSLKSAVYAVGLSFFPEWNDPKYFFEGCRISSCFPYAGIEYFFPKPQILKHFRFSITHNDKAAKKSKKIEFLTKPVFEKFLDASVLEIEVDEKLITPDHMFLCNEIKTAENVIFKTEVQQRVAVPKEGDNEDSRPFYIDRIYFSEKCGLFFLAEFLNPDLRNQFFKALKILGENGIGTDRTVGNGLFSFDMDTDVKTDFSFQIKPQATKQITLGLYLPKEDELEKIKLDESHWSLFKRGGYMAAGMDESLHHLRRKEIYMFGEGSVFDAEDPLTGRYVDLKPDWNPPLHPSWRCGMPIFLKF